MFSLRTAWSREPTDLTAERARRFARGEEVLDLSCSNPTTCGFRYASEFYASLFDERGTLYEPHALGLPMARAAVSRYYGERGRQVPIDTVWLAASTSELYAGLLWLFCDPGDSILTPRPGYPLFDYLGDLAGVARVPYRLTYQGTWCVDLDSVRHALDAADRPRAVIAVSPNNPTGSFLRREEHVTLENLCAERDLPLVVDEVFADYPLGRATPWTAVSGKCLTATVSGLSKVAALPQLKLSWGVLSGPEQKVAEALARLEVVADTFLSAATPVQEALPSILASAGAMRERLLVRCRQNLSHLREALSGTALSPLHVEGGWSALVRLPRTEENDDASWALRLLKTRGVYVQPGYLYDMPEHLAVAVVSLLTEPTCFKEGIRRLVSCAG